MNGPANDKSHPGEEKLASDTTKLRLEVVTDKVSMEGKRADATTASILKPRAMTNVCKTVTWRKSGAQLAADVGLQIEPRGLSPSTPSA